MEIIEIGREKSLVSLSRAELLIVNAALNEICNGIAVFEFETRIGADRNYVATLLKEFHLLLDEMVLSEKG
ncbi:hypothetical protein [Methylovulum psychrotolerans]|uniref:Uncharacterized protein n=1 Tax=Methylovulum psychrotolerans TaxID=1704499 RepID=A0A2S5CHV3_9GAMM|nr:hypothetical protein [Methylovulum psychrotolerans]POZ50385.1 hypothetical protein AADEFJLK_03798 [Methylovulum psychrotolerans]